MASRRLAARPEEALAANLPARRAEGQAQKGHDHHDSAVAVHRRQIARLPGPRSDNPGRDEGQQDLHDHLQGGQANAAKGILLILLQLT